MTDADWKITSVELESREGGKGNVAVTCTNAGDGGLSIAIPLVGDRKGFRLVKQHLAASRYAKTYFFQTPFSIKDLKTGTVKLFDQNRVLRAEASIPFSNSSAPAPIPPKE